MPNTLSAIPSWPLHTEMCHAQNRQDVGDGSLQLSQTEWATSIVVAPKENRTSNFALNNGLLVLIRALESLVLAA